VVYQLYWNIELQKNVSIQADEDYIRVVEPGRKTLSDSVGLVWKQYGSATMLQSIPSVWIESIGWFEPNHRQNEYEKNILLRILKIVFQW